MERGVKMMTINNGSLEQAKLKQLLPLPGFITYETKGSCLYGRYFNSTFLRDGKVYHTGEYLGRVIDRELGLFRNRDRGYFTFSLENGYGNPDPLCVPLAYELPQNRVLFFGDIWMVDQIFKQSGLDEVLNNLIPNGGNTLKALVSFRLLESHAYSFAEEWYSKSYASILYPGANLESGLISKFHAILGREEIFNKFFSYYLNLVTNNTNINEQVSIPVLIDSTGLPNDINTYLTKINNHNGVISNEMRLIYVLDKRTKLPIYFTIISGNIIDNSTLVSTINSLAAYNINIELLIMDAGYYSMENIAQLLSVNIPFLTRMTKNRKIYKELMACHGKDLICGKNTIKYGHETLFGKKVPFNLFDKELYAYIMVDPIKKFEEYGKFISDLDDDLYNDDILNKKLASSGRFILVSSDDYDIKEILPLYYTRQAIEQVFDVSKNFADILPLRGHSEETIKGRILIAFIVTIIYCTISNKLRDTKICTNSAIYSMHNLHIKIYESTSLLEILTKKQKDIFQYLALDCPFSEEKGNLLTNNRLSTIIKSGTNKKGRGRPKGSTKKIITTDHSNLTTTTNEQRRRGRPKGSKNKINLHIQSNNTTTSVIKRKRGRPIGSKNKIKVYSQTVLPPNFEKKSKRGRPKGSKNKRVSESVLKA
jgi:transposase